MTSNDTLVRVEAIQEEINALHLLLTTIDARLAILCREINTLLKLES